METCLAYSPDFRTSITTPGDYNKLPEVASELGFREEYQLPTKKASWQIYDRPDESPKMNSTIAIYGNEGNLNHIILRTSLEPYLPDKLNHDLTALTKHYIERPRFRGFPSHALTSVEGLFISIPIGMTLLSVTDYCLLHSTGTFMNVGILLGDACSLITYGTLWGLSEKHAKKQISHPAQYTVGDIVKNILLKEHSITFA